MVSLRRDPIPLLVFLGKKKARYKREAGLKSWG